MRNAKMTGDRMEMLMLTLPFMVLDLIAPEGTISEYERVCTGMYSYVLACTKYVSKYYFAWTIQAWPKKMLKLSIFFLTKLSIFFINDMAYDII